MLFGRTTRKPISIPAKAVKEWKYSTCNYCSTGCVIELGLNDAGKIVTSCGHAGADVNRGKLCIKGILEQELFESPGRGSQPLMRERAHLPFQAASWDAALDKTAAKIKEIQAKYGRDAFAVVSTGQLLTEEFYTLGKLVRGQIGTNNYDGNTTLCMASAVSGYKRSFGSDGPPGCYGDFEHTHCLKAFGSNLAGFTAFAQSALYVPLAIVCLGLVGFGLFMSTLHLGKPLRFYRGFNNLRHSPVSREGLGIAIFMSALGGHIVFSLPGNSLCQALVAAVFSLDLSALPGGPVMVAAAFLATAFGYLAVLGSIGGLYYMMRCYRIKARPFWNHWQVGTAFGGSVLSLGAVLAGTVIFVTLALGGASGASVFIVTLVCTALLALGLLIEAVWHIAHARAIGLANMPQVGVALLRH